MPERRLMALALGLAVAGCASVGPDYQRPPADLPGAWPAAAEPGAPVGDRRWWSVFADATLDRLVDKAIADNADLALAVARVDEARALLGVSRADQYPQLNAGATRSRTRFSQLGDVPLPPGTNPTVNDTRIALDASYQIDLWGRYRRATEAARADLLASQAARDTVYLALTAQVAQAYYALVGFDVQIEVTRRTIETRREALRLERLRYEAGTVSEFDLRQTEAELAAAQALLPVLVRGRAQQENALAVLLGRSPRAIVAERIAPATGGAPPPVVIPAGLPSDLLQRRPDLREAEEHLIAANARIGVARAAYFPSISLTGFLGSESTALSSLFTGPAGIWQLAASLAVPLFNGGRTAAQVDAANARQQQALAQYRRAVQSAFRDVQDALVAQSEARHQFDAEAARAAALEQALRLARLRYENGTASLLEVLDAERNLLAAELNRADALRAQRAAIADIVKALGGGWSS